MRPQQEELETAQQKQATFARADKRHKELQKEVKQLQEALADHNMVLDKVGHCGDVFDMTYEIGQRTLAECNSANDLHAIYEHRCVK